MANRVGTVHLSSGRSLAVYERSDGSKYYNDGGKRKTLRSNQDFERSPRTHIATYANTAPIGTVNLSDGRSLAVYERSDGSRYYNDGGEKTLRRGQHFIPNGASFAPVTLVKTASCGRDLLNQVFGDAGSRSRALREREQLLSIGSINAGLQRTTEREDVVLFYGNLGRPGIMTVGETGSVRRMESLFRDMELGTVVSKKLGYQGDHILLSWDQTRFQLGLELPRMLVREVNDLAKAQPVLLQDRMINQRYLFVGVHLSRDKEIKKSQLDQISRISEPIKDVVDFDSTIVAGDFNTQCEDLDEIFDGVFDVNVRRPTAASGCIDNVLSETGGPWGKYGSELILYNSDFDHHPLRVNLQQQ